MSLSAHGGSKNKQRSPNVPSPDRVGGWDPGDGGRVKISNPICDPADGVSRRTSVSGYRLDADRSEPLHPALLFGPQHEPPQASPPLTFLVTLFARQI